MCVCVCGCWLFFLFTGRISIVSISIRPGFCWAVFLLFFFSCYRVINLETNYEKNSTFTYSLHFNCLLFVETFWNFEFFFSQFSPNYNLRNSFTFVDCWALFCNISLVSCWKFTERLDFDLQSFNVISLGNYLKKKDLAVHFFRFDNRIVTRNASLLFFLKKKKTRFIHFPPVDTPSPSVLIIFLLFSMFFFLGRFSIVFRALLYGASISIIFLSVLCRSFYFDPTGPLAGPTTST